MTTRVLIADDEWLIRAGYRMILDSEPDMEVVGEAADGVELLAALRGAPQGVTLFSPTVTRRLIEAFAPRQPRESTGLAMLTERETQVLTQVALGRSNTEISRELSIGETTVKTHVSRVLAKLNLTSRSQAVVLAYETGLVHPGQSAPT